MENILDIIFPLIFVAVFILNSLSKADKQKKKDEKGSGTSPVEGNDPLSELREEIRRRVEENQRGRERNTGNPMMPRPVSASPTASSIPAPTYQQRQQQQRVLRQEAENREVAERMKRMQQMQHQVKEMQRRADAEKRKAAKMVSGNAKRVQKKHPPVIRSQRSSFVREVIRDLKTPGSSRKAILNAEILGTPIGLRKASQSQALWGG